MYGRKHVLVAKNSKGVSDEFTPDILFAVVASVAKQESKDSKFLQNH